jgi:periplasmic protein TonB
MFQVWLYRYRDPASYVVALLGCALALLPQSLLHTPKVTVEPTDEIVALIEMPPAPPLPVPPTPVSTPIPRVATQAPMPRQPVQGLPVEPAPPPTPAAPTAPVPTHETPRPEEPVRSAQPTQPAPPSSAAYARQILALADRAKRYPTSREARLSHPEGTAHVWLVLERSGRQIDIGIEASSHSNLLDQEALKTIRQITFPPFTEGIYPGETTHRFIVNMKYEIQNDN